MVAENDITMVVFAVGYRIIVFLGLTLMKILLID